MTWSKHSRRTDPISRSAKRFCQGEAGAVGLSRMPMARTPQDNQLMSKHRVLSFKPQLRLEWRGQHGQSETEQPDHSASLGDSTTSSTQIRFSVHTRSRACDEIDFRTRTIRRCAPMRSDERRRGYAWLP